MVMEATPAFPHGPPSSNIKALGMSRGETVCHHYTSKREKWTGKLGINGKFILCMSYRRCLVGFNRTETQEAVETHEKDLDWRRCYQVT